jgi:phospholipase A1
MAAESPSLEKCAAIGPAADRLSCYDQLAGRAPSAPVPTTADEAAAAASGVTTTSLLAPKDTPAAAASPQQRTRRSSLMSSYWELDPEDKRGTFNLTGYHPNFVLPVHATSRINRSPQSPTQATVQLPAYKSVEAKFQLSFRTKVLQDFGLKDADVWMAFTQQTLWQIWNGKDSKPFRNSDYEPEVMYVVPTPAAWQSLPFGWSWRYAQFALAHQSNGQADPLSRSWNRVYLGTGFERGDWSLTAKLAHRLGEKLSSDNNPDFVDYRGRGEFQLNWAPGITTTSLLYRSSLKDVKYGALQLEWTYPVFNDQPNGMRYFVQVFRGYGETLTDYNFRQTSLGAGVSFMQF